MQQRINIFEKGKDALKAVFMMGNHIRRSTIEPALRELIDVRVSQINGCAYCLDMHYKEARAKGETEQRLYGLNTWRETTYYSTRERAGLAWAEAITKCEVPDELYEKVKAHFTDEELIDLTMIANNINNWNRINIAFPQVAGSYVVGQFG